MKEVIEFLKTNLKNKETVVVACSGGPDSMFLMDAVNSLKEEKNLTIICAHVNHCLRKESEKEALMVQDYANKNKDIFELLEISTYLDGEFSEADARSKRYEFFEFLIDEYKATTLLTAHHGDDLIETVLMRITRGSTLSGYAGIRSKTKNKKYQILRPLLNLSKEDILKYLKDNKIKYAIDKSNNSNNYTRNRYRKNVVKFLHEEQADVQKKYLKFSNELLEYEEFVNNYIFENKFVVDNCIDINKVKDNKFIFRKCIELIVKEIQKKDIFDISDQQINELLKLKSSKSINLNNNYLGINNYDKLMIIKDEEKHLGEYKLDKDLSINEWTFYYNSKEATNTNEGINLSSKEIALPLKIRPVKNGDKMYVKNLNGTKKVNDILIDCKIPKYKRKSYPILVDNNDVILWIPNVKKSQFAKDKTDFCDIIVRCEER